MGWKTFKERFGIEHIVSVTEKGICIGSSFVLDLATVDIKTGRVSNHETFANFVQDKYPLLAAATAEEVLESIAASDTFAVSIPVYTYRDDDIIEKKCEQLGWPNATHDGCLMYENEYFTDKHKVAARAKKIAGFEIEYGLKEIARLESNLEEYRARVDGARIRLAKLEAAYPSAAETQAPT